MAGTTQYYGVTYPTSTDYVTNGAVAIEAVADGFDAALAIPTYNAQTGTSYTFVLLDAAKTVTASNAAASTYTIPPQASVVWTTGATLKVINLGAGVVTFAGGVGVTVTNTAQTLAQYQSALLIRTGSNAWTVTLDSGGASGLTLVKTQTIGTGVSSVSVTGAFNANFENYKILLNGGVASTNNILRFSLDGITGSVYTDMRMGVTSAGASSVQNQVNGTNFSFSGSGDTGVLRVNLDVNGPFLAKGKMVQNPFFDTASGTISQHVGIVASTTSATAFTLTASTGTMTGGTIYVYGYGLS